MPESTGGSNRRQRMLALAGAALAGSLLTATTLRLFPRLGNTTFAARQQLFGHYAYDVAPENSLTPVTPDGKAKLRHPAAKAYAAMQAAAQADGIRLKVRTAFRDLEHQERLFFEEAAFRKESPAMRAREAAPPGYSEHHTGYAIDLADEARKDDDPQTSFADTPSFAWLKRNAARFHFELSFPSGPRFEPWHWRFVGDRQSLQTFYGAAGVTGPKTSAP